MMLIGRRIRVGDRMYILYQTQVFQYWIRGSYSEGSGKDEFDGGKIVGGPVMEIN